MISSTIAQRYARAFFGIAAEEGLYDNYYDELGRFSAVLRGNRSLSEFLANPVFDQHDKKAVVESILAKIQLSPLTANFLRLLVDKRRISILDAIEAHYRKLVNAALNRVMVAVTTAFPLSGELSARLRTELERLTGKEVAMTVVEDPSLLGGITVRVGDTLYDGSIRAQLNNIRYVLGEEQ